MCSHLQTQSYKNDKAEEIREPPATGFHCAIASNRLEINAVRIRPRLVVIVTSLGSVAAADFSFKES